MIGDINDFLNHNTWAVVGVSNNQTKYGYKVYNQLKKTGYSVFAVNPRLESIDGDPCYSSLSVLPMLPDAVSVIVPPKITEQVIQDCINLGIKRVWLQPGSESREAIRNGEVHGITVIHDHCVLVQTRNRI